MSCTYVYLYNMHCTRFKFKTNSLPLQLLSVVSPGPFLNWIIEQVKHLDPYARTRVKFKVTRCLETSTGCNIIIMTEFGMIKKKKKTPIYSMPLGGEPRHPYSIKLSHDRRFRKKKNTARTHFWFSNRMDPPFSPTIPLSCAVQSSFLSFFSPSPPSTRRDHADPQIIIIIKYKRERNKSQKHTTQYNIVLYYKYILYLQERTWKATDSSGLLYYYYYYYTTQLCHNNKILVLRSLSSVGTHRGLLYVYT